MLSQTSRLSLTDNVCSEMRPGYALIINIRLGYCMNFSDRYSYAEKPECRRCVNYGAEVSCAYCLEA